jgi:NAD(P)-dependent dehydrogenase (short-subunit alcohol dehydrogenase family)
MNVPSADKGAALITGSSRGIGKGIAMALAEAGFNIAANDREGSDALNATLAELQALGIDATAVVGDVSDITLHDGMLDKAETELGPLTTLVNNAGVSVLSRGDLLDVTSESFDRCHAINNRGAFFLTQAFARRLSGRERNPDLHHAIINITSCNVHAVSITRGEYCISKTGMSMMSKLFAVRLGDLDIGAYEIQPGVIETDMTAPVQEMYRKRIADGLTVTPRMGTPADIGSIARAMATGQLAYCTGQAVHADGGLLIPRL